MTQATLAAPRRVELDGRSYFILDQDQYEDLTARAAGVRLPPYPARDVRGNSPAVAFARVSIARELILRRLDLGWTQEDLAAAAGVNVATISRLESAKHTPKESTVDKLDTAMKQAATKPKA